MSIAAFSDTDLVLDTRPTREAVSSADHAHDFETLERSSGRLHRLKTSGEVNDSLESAVVRFDAPPYRLLPDHTLRGSRQRLGAG